MQFKSTSSLLWGIIVDIRMSLYQSAAKPKQQTRGSQGKFCPQTSGRPQSVPTDISFSVSLQKPSCNKSYYLCFSNEALIVTPSFGAVSTSWSHCETPTNIITWHLPHKASVSTACVGVIYTASSFGDIYSSWDTRHSHIITAHYENHWKPTLPDQADLRLL